MISDNTQVLQAGIICKGELLLFFFIIDVVRLLFSFFLVNTIDLLFIYNAVKIQRMLNRVDSE